jgi:ribosomal protein S27AE
MSQPSEDEKQVAAKIVKMLQERGVSTKCPRCGNNTWTLMPGFFILPFQKDVKGYVIGGPTVPAIAVICNKCGYISQHSAGVLGFLLKEEPKHE